MRRIGEYQLLGELGDGYTSQVFRARGPRAPSPVALKAPSPLLYAQKPKLLRLFSNEAQVLQKLAHPNIIRLLDFQEKAEVAPSLPHLYPSVPVPLLAFELAPHGELCAVILNTGRLSANASRFYFFQLLGALGHLHERGYVHRDVKPENLLLSANFDLKLIDFAFCVEKSVLLAAQAEDQRAKADFFSSQNSNSEKTEPKKTLIGTVGTQGYLPLEILQKKSTYSEKSDLFAVGVVLFIMLRGVPPFGEGGPDDPHLLLFHQNPKLFWSYHESLDGNGIKHSFRELIHGLLGPEKDRWTIQKVLEGEWMREGFDEKAAKAEMAERVNWIKNNGKTQGSASGALI